MKKLTVLLSILTLSSCGIQWKYSTLNHTGHLSNVHTVNDYEVDTLTESQFRNKLRTDKLENIKRILSKEIRTQRTSRSLLTKEQYNHLLKLSLIHI